MGETVQSFGQAVTDGVKVNQMPNEYFHFWYPVCNPDTLHRANKTSNLSQTWHCAWTATW